MQDRAAIATYLKSLPPRAATGLGNAAARTDGARPRPLSWRNARAAMPADGAAASGIRAHCRLSQPGGRHAGDGARSHHGAAHHPDRRHRAAAPRPAAEVKPMPAFAKLDDGMIADVASYIRNAWGNSAPPVNATQVHALRQALKNEAARPTHRSSARTGTWRRRRRPDWPAPTSTGPRSADPASGVRPKRAAFSCGMTQMARGANSITTPGRSVRMAAVITIRARAPSFRRLRPAPRSRNTWPPAGSCPAPANRRRDAAPPTESGRPMPEQEDSHEQRPARQRRHRSAHAAQHQQRRGDGDQQQMLRHMGGEQHARASATAAPRPAAPAPRQRQALS